MKSKGIDFSALFDPDVVGDGPTAPDYRVGGVPLRFAALKYGTKRADVGYAEKGVDVSNKWAAKGTAKYLLGPPDGIIVENTGAGAAFTALTINSDGTWTASDGKSGYWYGSAAKAGVGAGYELQATVGGGGPGTVVNPAVGYVSLSASRTISYSSTSTGSRTVTMYIRPLGVAAIAGTVQLFNTIDG